MSFQNANVSGAAYLNQGKVEEAAREFLKAGPLQPQDELARVNTVLAYHLLGDVETTHNRAEQLIDDRPHSTGLLALWVMSAPQSCSLRDLEDRAPISSRKDAEVASALSRRAINLGHLDQGIEYATLAVRDKPGWSQAHLLLAQARFAKVVLSDRKSTPLDQHTREAVLSEATDAAEEAFRLGRIAAGHVFNPYGKTKAAKRRVHLTARAREVCERRMAEAEGCYLFPHEKSPDRPMLKANNAHQGAVRRSRVRPFRLYDLRHTFASRAAMAGIDLVTLAAMLGHARIQMVLRYAHPTDGHQAQAVKRLEEFNAAQQIEEFERLKSGGHPLQISLQ